MTLGGFVDRMMGDKTWVDKIMDDKIMNNKSHARFVEALPINDRLSHRSDLKSS